MKKTTKTLGVLFTIFSIFLILGCSESRIERDQGNNPADLKLPVFDPDAEIVKETFSSTSEYQAFVKQYSSGTEMGYPSSMPIMRTFGAEVMEDSMAIDDAVAQKVSDGNFAGFDESGGSDFSQTNNQVAKVDEADIIKTDGKYIYTITGNTLFIVDAYPGEDAEVLTKLTFDYTPRGLFIEGDTLAVFGNFYDLDYYKEMDIAPRQSMTFINVYDLTDIKNPSLLKEYKVEGDYFRGRLYEGTMYLVTRTMPTFRINHPTPLIIEDDDVRMMPAKNIAFFPISYRQPQLVTLHALDLNDLSSMESIGIMVEYNQNVYMSEESMFITYSEQINEWDLRKEILMDLIEPQLTESDKTLIKKIEETDGDILTIYEKDQKIYQIYSMYLNFMTESERELIEEETNTLLEEKIKKLGYLEYTIIDKVALSGTDMNVVANGKVPGQIINQFSMDENRDIFRIATTINARWSTFEKERTESENHIYTLDNNLNVIGKLTGIAQDERIFSTRFIDDRLYMVTFKQVDPFFVFDLSDPANPKELGKLKLPGFSRYLHPYDENIIIGIGRDANDRGRTQGLKISLFDVTDVEKPKEIAKWVSDEKYAQSSVLYEHRAFLFSKDKELLVIPAYNYDYRNSENTYNGAMVFKINEDEIKLRGLIDHSGSDRVYGPQVERSLYIEELLYTKSSGLLRINDIDSLEKVKNIELKPSNGKIPIY